MRAMPTISTDAAAGQFEDPLHARIAEFIYREAGIVLGPEKVNMMNARLAKRLIATGTANLAEYVAGIDGNRWPGETGHLVSSLTTNFTHFFRETHHFDFLRETVVPGAAARGQNLRIWSAGCSSGQEPYSIAITARQADTRLSITATDIDQTILARAADGRYSAAEIGNMAPEIRNAGFQLCEGGYEVRRQIRQMVHFSPLNLHGSWPFDQPFDAIFCRNVIIYFDSQAQMRLWDKFRQNLRPGGWLFIGHSERIPDQLRDRLRPAGRTIYQYLPD